MKFFLVFPLLLSSVLAAPLKCVEEEHETPKAHEKHLTHSTPIRSLSESPTNVLTTSGKQGSNLTSESGYASDKQPQGLPGFPLNGKHISAPPQDDPVPDGAAIYHDTSFLFDCAKFMNWTQAVSKDHTSSGGSVNPHKWLKVPAGTYEYALGAPATGSDPDPNLYAGRNIRFVFFDEGWTLDLRGVTFSIPITPENSGLRPWDAIYVNQAPNFTILGGTIWFDQGEIYTYATITSYNDQTGAAQISVDKGYNTSSWATDLVNARNVACYEISDWPRNVSDGQCNFWYMSDYSFDAGSNTATANFDINRSNIKQGMVLVKDNSFNTAWAVSSETEGGLVVRGLTTNGEFIQIGTLDNGAAALYEDVYLVNPPARPGVAPRYGGPGMQWGHLSAFYDAPGLPDIQFKNCFYQTYGGSQNLVQLTAQTQ